MSYYYSTIPVVDDGRTYAADTSAYYNAIATDLLTDICNWQAAFIESTSPNHNLEFHVTGKTVTGTQSLGNSASPVLNGMQLIPVLEFIQPGVNSDNDPMEYGPLAAGDYLLMHVHGGVNVEGSQPKYAGGFYRFVYSTEDSPAGPQIVRLHHPEINRYNTGPAVVEAYSGKQYTFSHTGGYIQFSFDDISEHYGDNTVTTGGPTGTYVQHGLNYADTTVANPIAPVFALIDLAVLRQQDEVVNPPLFNPSYGLLSSSGENVTIYSTTVGTSIYYTKTTAALGTEPLDPPVPTFDAGGSPTGTTTLYSGVIPITEATKFKAVAKKASLPDSPLSSIYYFGKKDVPLIEDASDLDDDPLDDAVAAVVYTPPAQTLPISDAVSLTTVTPGAVIYYTMSTTVDINGDVTDPATPTTASTVYTTPFNVVVPTKFKAFAVKAGLVNAPVTSAYYTNYTTLLGLVTFTPPSTQYTDAEFGVGFSSTMTFTP